MQVLPPPIFVRSNIRFGLYGREYSFPSEGVSLFGVSGLRVPHFDPTDTVGEMVDLEVEVLAREPLAFRAKAMLTAECTVDAIYLGMKFALQGDLREKLGRIIATEGYYPTNYMRKFPRIPAKDVIPSMPLRAIAATTDEELIAFDIANMSPNGILLQTENSKAALLVPSVRMHGQIEPRGAELRPVEFDGLVCRMLLDMNAATRNVRRYLGIRFTQIPEEQRMYFLEILRAVLHNIQQQGLG